VIAACYTCRNEADIVEASFRHMLAEDVALIMVSDGHSDDGTRQIIDALAAETGRIVCLDDPDPVHRQPALTMMLAHEAAERGADWIICSDVDEFWFAPGGLSISETLAACPHEKLFARVFQHNDWDTRRVEPQPWPVVAFRYREGVQIDNGNHDCSLPGGEYGVLDVRELHHRGFEHFCQKATDRTRTLDPVFAAQGHGVHQTRIAAMSDEQRTEEWESLQALPTVHDPIPSRSDYRPGRSMRVVQRERVTWEVDAPPSPVGFDFWTVWEQGWEQATLEIVDRFARPSVPLLDVGAWIGPVSMWAARTGPVVALEPDPVALTYLRRNAKRNGCGRITVIAGALGACSGSARIARHEEGWGSSMTRVTADGEQSVRSWSLTELFADCQLEDCSLVKMDIEGGESLLLPFVAPFLAQRKVPLLVAMHEPLWDHPLDPSWLHDYGSAEYLIDGPWGQVLALP
jgi:FkbM family methyltransferase